MHDKAPALAAVGVAAAILVALGGSNALAQEKDVARNAEDGAGSLVHSVILAVPELIRRTLTHHLYTLYTRTYENSPCKRRKSWLQ